MKTNHITFQSLSVEWLSLKKMYVKYSTYTKYENIINIHLIPYFNEYSLNDINDQLIVLFFSEETQKKKLSTSSIKTIRFALKSILELAEEKYDIHHINFNFFKLPKNKDKCHTLSSEEKQCLEKYSLLHCESICICILLGLYAGLRIGEICALQWEDIDFKTGTIEIKKTVQRLRNKNKNESKTILIISDPKTSTSQRIVPMPLFLKEYLYLYYQNNKDENQKHYIVSNTSKLIDPRTIQYRFKNLCLQFNIHINFHALRHTYATNCVMSGVDVKSLSEILGHSNISTTLNLYVHSSLEFKMNQINKINMPILS